MSTKRRPSPGHEDILDAAELLMARKGIDSTSIADICRASGLPVGSIYWHFSSKAGLIAAVMARGAERFFDGLPHPGSFSGDADECFRQWFDANTRLIERRPDFLRLHLSLCLLDESEGSVRETTLRVRSVAIERLSSAITPWLSNKGVPNAAEHGLDLADTMLSAVDGAFIADLLGVSKFSELMSSFYSLLCARAVELTAS
ncbi:MAG: hypothetical protein QOK08_2545 [Actinomycetota bacterium]|jgi:AcrR family transcriptional regulator|nr:hypothetical protein [Actinomycetota bacterium]